MIKLRDYQEKTHEELIKVLKQNLRGLIVIMAGGGKSITAGSFIAKFNNFFKFVLIVRKRDLVEQLADDALDTFGLDYGVFMAGHPKMDLSKSIQVCSKDTMQARNRLPFLGEENVIVLVDEADEFKDYQEEIQKRYREEAKRVFFIGMTATPFNGLGNIYDEAIEPIKPKELLKRGVLVPFIYYIPRKLDMTDVEVINGEWKKEDVIKKLDTNKAISECFNSWLEYGQHRQTFIFCINIDHAKRFREFINNYYGKPIAEVVTGKTPKDLREDIKNDFITGKVRFLILVKVFIRGTNIKEIGCILDCAPTLRVNPHIQKLGRGSRANAFYKDCILIDCANNLLTNGGFYTDRPIDLSFDYKRTKSELETLSMRVCESCFRADEPSAFGAKNICPFCGHKNAPIKKKKLSEYKKEKLFMETASEEQIEQKRMIAEFKKVLWKKQNLPPKSSKSIARMKAVLFMLEKYGVDKCLKIKKSIGLKEEYIKQFEREKYVPLGGMQL